MALTYGFCLGDENSQYDSKQFSEAFQSAFGDGITGYGGKFKVTSNSTMNLTIASGFALVAGRWIKSDVSDTLTVQPADNNFDRYDAVIIRVNFVRKSIGIFVVQGPATAFPTPYTPVRTDEIYEIMLCSILVRMGATQILDTDLTDTRADVNLCGFITPLQDVAVDILYIYNFLNSGIDENVSELEEMAQAISDNADKTIQQITSTMLQAGVKKPVGEIEISRIPPNPESVWLLCDGSSIPTRYSMLSALLDGVLPNISQSDDRYQAWIYAGEPDKNVERRKNYEKLSGYV